MKAQDPSSKPGNSPIWKRDLRDCSIRPFGRYIASFDWSAIFNIHDCDIKYEKFNDTKFNVPVLPSCFLRILKKDLIWWTTTKLLKN